MAKHIRKPKPIDAVQWDGTVEGKDEIEAHFPYLLTTRAGIFGSGWIAWRIATENGSKNVLPGQYVYKNEDGEFWTMHAAEIGADYDEVKS